MIRRRHSTEPLGISIAGGFGSALGDVPIFIAAVDDNGPAADKLRIGERIITINGQSSERISHNECAQMLRASPQNVNLEVRFSGFFVDFEEFMDFFRWLLVTKKCNT